jgi:hypothetical protein
MWSAYTEQKKYENCMENIKFARRKKKRFYQKSEYEVHQVGPKMPGAKILAF